MATYGGLPTCLAGTAQELSQTSLLPLHSHQEEDTTLIPFHRSKQTREVSAWPRPHSQQVMEPRVWPCVSDPHTHCTQPGWSSSPDSPTRDLCLRLLIPKGATLPRKGGAVGRMVTVRGRGQRHAGQRRGAGLLNPLLPPDLCLSFQGSNVLFSSHKSPS